MSSMPAVTEARAKTASGTRQRVLRSLLSARTLGDDLLAAGPAALRLSGVLRQHAPHARLEPNRWTDRQPVLLMHGYGGTDAVWDPLVRGLHSAGFGHVVRLSYNPFLAEVSELVAEIAEQVAAAIRDTGADGVHLVGHSLGGLLLRCAVCSGPRPLPATTVVTISSPHSGLTLARLAPGRCAGLMHRRSPLPQPRAGASPRWVAYYSDGDRVVRPSSARLTDPAFAATNVLVPGRGHLTICRDPRLVAGVVSQLVRSEQREVDDAAWRSRPAPRHRLSTVRPGTAAAPAAS
jgi:predicted alpha/beta hydrolase family esterase